MGAEVFEGVTGGGGNDEDVSRNLGRKCDLMIPFEFKDDTNKQGNFRARSGANSS